MTCIGAPTIYQHNPAIRKEKHVVLIQNGSHNLKINKGVQLKEDYDSFPVNPLGELCKNYVSYA